MSVVVFSGPSLPRSLVEAKGFVWRPPLRQGDLYRAAGERPVAIGVVDGFFETTPTVWHKEILWAMAEGIHVYGAASIGALRAVELEPFGMHGVGRVFEMFRDGVLEDDDEVAVLHGPEELGYVPVTEAMVNVRATLERAREAGILTRDQETALVAAAKTLFYKDRTWEAILEASAARHLDRPTRSRFKLLFSDLRIDQKQADAAAMLECLTNDLAAGPEPFRPTYRFAHTVAWQAATISLERRREIPIKEQDAARSTSPSYRDRSLRC